MKVLFVILGSVSLALGVIGIALPLLPTTPFLLLSATLYMHSSPKCYRWLIGHRWLGSYIKNYRQYRAIPLRVKCISVATLWITIGVSIYVVDDKLWAVRLLLLVVAIGVSWHILSLKTLR